MRSDHLAQAKEAIRPVDSSSSGALSVVRRARFLTRFAAAGALAFTLTLSIAPLNAEETTSSSEPSFLYDQADREIPSQVWNSQLYYDGCAASVDDRQWFAWLEFVPQQGDILWVGTAEAGRSISKNKVRCETAAKELACPRLTADESGNLWLTYEARAGDQWDVFAVEVRDDLSFGTSHVVSNSSAADILHATCSDRDSIWVAWQTDRNGQFDVVARRIGNGFKDSLLQVSSNARNDWHPALAMTSDRRLCVGWDAFDGESHNVVARFLTNDAWGEELAIAATPRFEGRVDLAADRSGQVWFAWEEGCENWGRPFRGTDTTHVRDAAGPLHRRRVVRLAAVTADEMLCPLLAPLPLPSILRAQQRDERPAGVEELGVFYERPRVCFDRSGRLWTFYRHYFAPWLGIEHRSHVESGWGVYGRYYDDNGWSPLHRLGAGQGDGMQRLELAPLENGVVATWTTGRTDRNPYDRPRGIAAAVIETEAPQPRRLRLANAAPIARAEFPPEVATPTPARTVGGQRYYLMFGDLHRHTDLSLCRVPLDGTLDDAYRYAVDAARLNFLAVTDHSRDISRGDALSLLWRRSAKEVYRRQLVRNEAMRFMPFYAYERSHNHTADHNVISLRGDMLRPHTYPIPQFWQELDEDTLTIPHQPIRRDTWEYQDDQLRPLLEMFQGCRDESIEDDAHRALDKGYHLGLIASSDHMSTNAGFAGVWTTDRSRPGILESMQARRTFAATAQIELAVLANQQAWMGEILPRSAEPVELSLTARGTAPIRVVRFIVDGQEQDAMVVGKRDVQLQRTVNPNGLHYAYFHLVQVDGNEAWSSPIWFEGSSPNSSNSREIR